MNTILKMAEKRAVDDAMVSVDIEVRANSQNESPALREGYEKPTYQVPHGGALSVPATWKGMCTR